jgi:methionine-rich copper-binding protein CopC
MKLSLSATAALSLLLLLSAQASAHAFLDHADPKVGSVVTASPAVIKIWFTQEIEPDFSVIEVRDSQGNQVDKKDSHVDANDEKLLIVSLPNLPDGQYAVSWKVVSVDTHHTQGDFKFTVKSGK